MIASLTTSQLYEALAVTPASHNILLVGKHGIGKSQIITAYYESIGLPVTTLFLGQMSDPGDLIGLPRIDTETGRTEFAPPYWFPIDGRPVALFLDELNRARPEMMQSVMDLVLNRRLAGRRLPEGSRIVAAVNDGAEYQVDELDPALLSRFNIYEFRPSAREWVEWARAKGLDERVVGFIERNPRMLDSAHDANAEPYDRTPDRRAWHRVSDIMQNVANPADTHFRIISGIVGPLAAAALKESLARKLPTAEELLDGFDSRMADRLSGSQLSDLSALNDGIFRRFDAGKLTHPGTSITSLGKYIDWLQTTHREEALAHFIGIFTGGQYPTANETIVTRSPGLYRIFTTFVRSSR